MSDITNFELRVLGYIIEAYFREEDNTTRSNMRYMATAPDGQVIAVDLGSATDAWSWARWHYDQAQEATDDR